MTEDANGRAERLDRLTAAFKAASAKLYGMNLGPGEVSMLQGRLGWGKHGLTGQWSLYVQGSDGVQRAILECNVDDRLAASHHLVALVDALRIANATRIADIDDAIDRVVEFTSAD